MILHDDLTLWLTSGKSRTVQISIDGKEYMVTLKDVRQSVTTQNRSLNVAIEEALFAIGRAYCGAI